MNEERRVYGKSLAMNLWGQGVYGKSLSHPLNFVVNQKWL